MQSRRNEEPDERSPTVKLRSQHRATAAEVGHNDPYPVSRHEVNNQSTPPRGRRSYSPNTLDVSRRGASVRDRTSGSLEGRDSYVWHLSGGSTEKARSKSPAYEQMRKRPHLDEEGVVNKKYNYVEPVGFDDSTNTRVRSVYKYDHGTSRMSKDKDYMENRVTSSDGHVMMGKKLIPVEDFAARGPHRLPQDMGSSLNYAEASGKLPLSSSSRGIDMGQYEHEIFQHRETVPSNKVTVMDSYKEEKPMFHSQDVSYSMGVASHSKDFLGTPQLKEFAGASSNIPRTEFLHSYQDDEHLPDREKYLGSRRKLTEPVGYNKYESVRDPEDTRRHMTLYQQRENRLSRVEYEDYLHRKSMSIGSNNHGYPADDLKRRMPSQSRVSSEHDYGHRDMSKPNIRRHFVDIIDNTDDSCGNSREGFIWHDRNLQKQIKTDYYDMSRSYTSKQGGEYLGSEQTHIEFGRKLPQDYVMTHFDASHNHQLSNLRSDYGFARGSGPEFQDERLISSSSSKYDAEQYRLGIRTKRMEEELDMYSDRILKRKYVMEGDVGRPSSKTIVSSRLHSAANSGGPYESEEQINEDIVSLHASRTKGYGHSEYRKVGRTYDRQQHGDSELDDWYTSQGSSAQSQRVPIRFYKNSGKYIKGNPRPASFTWQTSDHNDRRSNLHKQNKVWKRNEDYDEDINANDGDLTEDLVNYAEAEAELSEDSEEFNQLVHEAYLKYSKRLNLSQSVRRRYKDEGKAGSLFCIVCGRSNSKEFLDTQRLVRHAFMSHKIGLRAQHLGLHKAICVLLGWDSVAPPDTITWAPQALPEDEAFAQKEDLVLWPPIVVIHNISMANNNPQEQIVVPIEGVQAFLRSKGFVGGKITVCLGRPADQSIMVVKFLGTFTGLAMAERLHKYFVENKRGRAEFLGITSNNGKSSMEEIGIQGEKLEEQLLYGYMAIADDLDKLDFHTRKWSLIKSKKEIQDLANDPVKIDER